MRITKTIYIHTIILTIALIAISGSANAATTMEIGIPGLVNPGDPVSGVPEYIKYLYLFVLGFVGIAGFASIVFWGAVWTASGVVDQKSRALEGIKNALYGIGIAFTAFIILNTINPDLTVIKAPSVADIKIIERNDKMTTEQIKYENDTINCSNVPTISCGVGDSVGCKPMSNGTGKVCVPYYVFACDSFTEAYNNCKSDKQCQNQKISGCSQYIPISSGKCQWFPGSNSCVYVPNSK